MLKVHFGRSLKLNSPINEYDEIRVQSQKLHALVARLQLVALKVLNITY